MNELNVCVVDDDQYFNNLVTSIVKQKAAEQNKEVDISSFRDGYEFVRNGVKPDLLFLDFYLSTDNDITQTGLDVLKKAKAKNPGTKVVFMSQVHDWAMFKGDLIAEGAMDFIKKDDKLADSINRILKEAINKEV